MPIFQQDWLQPQIPPTTKDFTELRAELAMTFGAHSYSPQIIQQELVSQLAQKMLPYVNVMQHPPKMSAEDIFSASIFVAKPHIKHAQVETEGYYFKDHHFSESQIQESLLNTFPEEFI